jgi:hypothetical protein
MNFRGTSSPIAISCAIAATLTLASHELVPRSGLPTPPIADVQPATEPQQVVVRAIASTNLATVTYQQSNADFLNPERGFQLANEFVSSNSFSYIKDKGYTVSHTLIRLDEYRDRPLPTAFLDRLDRQFQLVRTSGIKVIPRFAYNFTTGEPKAKIDTSLEMVLRHINQLKPIFAKNADVILTLQGGFIGAWGEWHSSDRGLDRPQPKAKILAALLSALPPSRMVQLRTANDLQTLYPQPLTGSAAFRGSRQARVAFHNDCFLANQRDAGTYNPDVPAMKKYVSQIAPFIVVGGETCDATPAEHRTDCATAESELAKFHWSYLNSTFYKPTLDRWKQEGCYDRIARNLGYRLQLVRSAFPLRITADRQLLGSIVVKNLGYASPFNPRGLELILRHRQTQKTYRVPLLEPSSKTNDPRFWLPQAGEVRVDVRARIPRTVPSGNYELLLNLPDPMPRLANRPEYSIRLANEGTWEAKTGFNSLKRTIALAK